MRYFVNMRLPLVFRSVHEIEEDYVLLSVLENDPDYEELL